MMANLNKERSNVLKRREKQEQKINEAFDELQKIIDDKRYEILTYYQRQELHSIIDLASSKQKTRFYYRWRRKRQIRCMT